MSKQLRLNSFEDIKIDFNVEFSSLNRMISSNETNYSTHNLLPYPSKFIPQFPNLFVRYFSKPKMKILDPMCGGGTTLIESALHSRFGYGIDIDYIARLISKVSTTPIRPERIKANNSILLKNLRLKFLKISEFYKKIELPDEERFPNNQIWFREDTIKELILIHDEICRIDNSNYKDFARLCLYAIVKSVSNADPRDIFPERDLKNPIRKKKNVFIEFKQMLKINTKKVIDFGNRTNYKNKVKIIGSDARSIDLPDDVIDLIITSPPYAYAMDYPRIFKLATLLFIFNNEELGKLGKNYVGTDKISLKKELGDFKGTEFMQNDIYKIYEKDKKTGLIVYNYFDDMNKITSELYRILKNNPSNNRKEGGYLIYIIGNSTIRKTKFKTSDFLIQICKNNGFHIEDVLERPYYAYRMARKRANHSNTIKSDIFIIAKKG